MSRTMMVLVLAVCWMRPALLWAQESDPSAVPPGGAPAEAEAEAAPSATAAAGGPMDVCGTHESMQKFAREASRLVASREAPYFMVRQRLIRVNEHYLALYDMLSPLNPPKDDAAAEALWRFDALGELLQESSTNLERLAREMKTAARICNHDVATYEAEFGAACPNDAEVGCAEGIYAKYCEKARKRNRLLKIDEETQTGFMKWPQFFDNHWAGPTKVGEAGEGWREDWTYGSDEDVWNNLGREVAQDENRLQLLGQAEMVYSNYTFIDTKQLLARMVYNEVHGTMNGGGQMSLMSAVDKVGARLRKVMRCEASQALAGKPERIAPKKEETEMATEASDMPPAPGPAAATVE